MIHVLLLMIATATAQCMDLDQPGEHSLHLPKGCYGVIGIGGGEGGGSCVNGRDGHPGRDGERLLSVIEWDGGVLYVEVGAGGEPDQLGDESYLTDRSQYNSATLIPMQRHTPNPHPGWGGKGCNSTHKSTSGQHGIISVCRYHIREGKPVCPWKGNPLVIEEGGRLRLKPFESMYDAHWNRLEDV